MANENVNAAIVMVGKLIFYYKSILLYKNSKCIATGCKDPKDRLDNLGVNTFELFHLCMKVLSICYKELFVEENQPGTLLNMKMRIDRKQVFHALYCFKTNTEIYIRIE